MRLPRLLDPVVTIEDDRGERHVVDRRGWRSADSWRDPRTHFVVEEAIQRTKVGKAPGARVLSILCVLIGGTLGVALPVYRWASPSAIPLWFAVAGVLACCAAYALYRLRMPGVLHRNAEFMLRNALCPSCAYDLAAAKRDANEECLVCPECGGAWRTTRIGLVQREPGATWITPPSRLDWMRHDSDWGRRSILDDRRQAAPLLSRLPRQMLSVIDDEATRSRLLEAGRTLRRKGWVIRVPAAIAWIAVSVPLLVGALVFFRPALGFAGLVLPFMMLGFGVMFAVNGIQALRGSMGISGRAAKRALLGAALCPSCSDDLWAVEPEPDGCRVCPTCGAAWRLATPAAGP